MIIQALRKFDREHDLQGSISMFESLIRRFRDCECYYHYGLVLRQKILERCSSTGVVSVSDCILPAIFQRFSLVARW